MILNRLRTIFTIIQMAITISLVIIFMFLLKNKKRVRFIWASLQMKLLGIDIEVKGEKDPNANMLLMNHQSVLDIIVFEYLEKRDLAWISKKEIADIPWFGNIAKLPPMITVERESKKSLIKLIKDVKTEVNNDRPIAIFPEGTRTDGKKLRKFKSGAKIIAEKFEMTVQPIIIVGTRKILDSQNLTQQSGVVRIVYLDSVKVNKEDKEWYKNLEVSMKEALDKEVATYDF